MKTAELADAKRALAQYVEAARCGDFVTITSAGKPLAVLVSVEAATVACRPERPSFSAFLKTFPGGDIPIERNTSGSR
ncbi:type II toxin-antitoxin system Phd/YefM family antitoxin [Rhizobium sp. 21-4511-3d]